VLYHRRVFMEKKENKNIETVNQKKKLVVLSGAGISAESGIRTFRDSDGLWEGYDIYEVASPRGWAKDPKLVLDFYNMRRKDVAKAQPNAAHSNYRLFHAGHLCFV